LPSVRITGGEFRSRALKAPRGSATRPTSDKVREALLAILGERVANARVLDLYAGTGALGLEALSRGAAEATFVERGREALDALRANVRALGVEGRVRVLAAPVERVARDVAGPFDLVFADPPYADVGAAGRVLEEIVRRGALAERATVVLEHAPQRGSADQEGPEIPGLLREDTRRYGDSCLSFYARAL
jgi:16S rRNA (guanine(966)-N(2))-methyltransferase RsmD